MDKPEFAQFVEEIITEDMEAIKELIRDEVIPFYKYRYQQEKKIADAEIKKMHELEEEA